MEQLINHDKLDPYNNHKYNIIYSGIVPKNQQSNLSIPLVWIELICVRENARGNSKSRILIDFFEKSLLDKYPDSESIIIGLDIPGTKNNWQNKELLGVYSRLGFTFPTTDFHFYHLGAQLGYKIISHA